MEQKLIQATQKLKTLEREFLDESLTNKERLEKVRMCVNWTDNCCWC